MSQGTGSERERDDDIVLPSWIDAAITRSRGEDEPLESDASAEPLPEDAVEPMPDEVPFDEQPTAEYPRPVEPFPTFLDRRGSMEHANERVANEPDWGASDTDQTQEMYRPADTDQTQEMVRPESGIEELVPQSPPQERQPNAVDFLQRRVAEEFDTKRASIVSEAMTEDPVPGSEPIPLPVVPPRHRAPSGPWLMAALFFAAAALVLAVLIWLRPLPQ